MKDIEKSCFIVSNSHIELIFETDFVVTRGLFERGYFTKQGGEVRNMLMLAP